MQYAVAIDVGIKNLSLCAYDFVTSKVIHWANTSLVPNGRYSPALNVHYVREFVNRHHNLFRCAAVVIIERQMRCNMRIIEAVLQTMFFDRCLVISARSVKAHYDLSTRNYRANKAKAIEWTRAFIERNPGCFEEHIAEGFTRGPKQDDLADSLLLLMYYLDTYSNQQE